MTRNRSQNTSGFKPRQPAFTTRSTNEPDTHLHPALIASLSAALTAHHSQRFHHYRDDSDMARRRSQSASPRFTHLEVADNRSATNSKRLRLPQSPKHLGMAGRLPIKFSSNNVQTSQHGDHVAERVTLDQTRKQSEVNKRRWSATRSIRNVTTVTDEVES